MSEYKKKFNFNSGEIELSIGRFAPRAESSVLMKIGETVILTVVSVSKSDTQLDYFPLTIEYIEKHYAGGVISGSRFQKREGRPSDEMTLVARQVDHAIRSLFPKNFKKEVNVIINVLAYDKENDPEVMAVTSASLALMVSSIPFSGPSASVKVGIKDNNFILNPLVSVQEELDANFIVSVKEDRVLNIEGFGNEVPEEKMGELLDFAVENCQPLLDFQKEVAKEIGQEKQEFAEPNILKELNSKIESEYLEQITEGLYNRDKRDDIYKAIIETVILEQGKLDLPEEDLFNEAQVFEAVDYVARKHMRKAILTEEKRTSGRSLDEIRPLDIEVSVLPRVHGSAVFQRGQTQCLSVLTLGSLRFAQMSDGIYGEEEKAFIHHYQGPAYSLGEAGRFSYYPGRREIGHGHIAENALKKVLPSENDFPYTIRVVSEILAQRGSSSMAATCGTTLALMDAGVPITSPVAGISVGLITNDENIEEYKLLTDIEDVEDFYGDMDFKVTGTKKGVTAIQLDNKLKGVPVKILKSAFIRARDARYFLLDEMSKIIATPRQELSTYAPKVESVMIKQDRIGELIGPGGKVIKGILEKIGGDIDINIQDDGRVDIASASKEKIDQAKDMINNLLEEPEIGKVYVGKIDKVTNYGAFVDINENISGLIHVSELADKYVSDPATIVSEGQVVKVKLIKIENGKQSFSIKAVSSEDEKTIAEKL